MNPDKAKLLAIAEKLLERTGRGDVRWTESGGENEFQTSFEDVSVCVSRRRDAVLSIRVLNKYGQSISSAALEELEPGSSKLSDLYEAARRQALNVDATIDSLLNRLG